MALFVVFKPVLLLEPYPLPDITGMRKVYTADPINYADNRCVVFRFAYFRCILPYALYAVLRAHVPLSSARCLSARSAVLVVDVSFQFQFPSVLCSSLTYKATRSSFCHHLV